MISRDDTCVFCKIADLHVLVPAAGGLASRCKEYETESTATVDVIIDRNRYRRDKWPGLDEQNLAYMESAYQFYYKLLEYNGMYLHASAVELDGRAYLFSGPCGIGKSTHSRCWKELFGDRVILINDDKPALRRLEDGWYAYGTPWCGKDGINANRKVPLAGICFLKQSECNTIRRLSSLEASINLLGQTIHKLEVGELDLLLSSADHLIREIPIFELENRPEPEAALLSYETMRRAAEEAGL